ncbi:BnaC03g41240D [Brassica napus]|uniref:BnaC03g41240D protein n=1 Tax=Brassica napus TaxID=3708 RepID=A0A078HFA3_BRANA|nr:BnaC03g41240D [Brassica napus]
MAVLHPPPLPWNDAPLAPPGRYNLQGLMENHAFVGEAVIESAVGWLNAAQIESLLLAAEANLIPISTDPAPEGTTGLFVYNTRAYNDHRMYHHVGPASLIARQTLVNGDSFVKMGEAIGFNNNRYRKRVRSLGDYPLQVHRSPRALKVYRQSHCLEAGLEEGCAHIHRKTCH